LRSHRPIQYLKRQGWDVRIEAPGRNPHVAVFQKAYSEEDLAEAKRLKAGGVRLVADFCDNHLWVPRWTPALRARADRMRELAEIADVCAVSTPELAAALSRPSMVVRDALPLPSSQTTGLSNHWHARAHGPLRLLWFGTAGGGGQTGGIRDLAPLLPVLRELRCRLPVSLTVISNSRSEYRQHVAEHAPGRYLPWSVGAFTAVALACDVAVIPVSLDPFTRCKTSNRPATALLSGLACVADPVPSYLDLREGIRFGSWMESLLAYASADVRMAEVRAGQAAVRAFYDPAVVTGQWATVLQTALDGGHAG
jgi:hypothetical protein